MQNTQCDAQSIRGPLDGKTMSDSGITSVRFATRCGAFGQQPDRIGNLFAKNMFLPEPLLLTIPAGLL
jgi:hypothetical protein